MDLWTVSVTVSVPVAGCAINRAALTIDPSTRCQTPNFAARSIDRTVRC